MASELMPVVDLELDATIQGLTTSQQVFGRYTLRQVLGRGGMGVVWLALDERLERKVALKFVSDVVGFDAAALDDLKRETRRCLDLTHPNIIRIHDFMKDSRAAAISMEYIDGKTLASLRVEKAQRVFEVEEIERWLSQICGALQYAHEEAKIVHRDLKPANLMLTSRGQIKIADFGISRSVGDSMSLMTMRRATSGTLGYMSPQQLNGDMPRVTDDVYALGATIYEFLTSKPPFHSGDIPHQARIFVPPTMAKRRQEFGIAGAAIPRGWEEAVAACLAKMPEERPQNMFEVAQRFGLNQVTVRSAPTLDTPPAPAAKKWVRLNFRFPKIPFKPLPNKDSLRIAGLITAMAIIGLPLLYVEARPFLVAPGEVVLSSNPPGATVHLPGRADQVTPATFSPVRIGRYQVTVSKEGFDSVGQSVVVTKGARINLGTIQLKRAMGQLNLVAFPHHAHYTLDGMTEGENIHKEGSTPDSLSDLPSGSYRLTLSEAGFTPEVETIQVPPHETAVKKIDLVLLAAAAHAGAGPAKVLRGEMDAGQLDDEGRAELAALLEKTFEGYLNHGLFAAAAAQLVTLKSLGMDTDAQLPQLQEKTARTEKETGAEVGSLMADGKDATAEEKLKNLDGVLQKESLARLSAPFQAPLTAYQQQIDTALQARQPSPAAAYDQLKPLAARYPDDLQVQLALAQVQMHMSPDHERLTAELKVLRQFSEVNPDFAGEPALSTTRTKFADELTQLDALSQALSDAKNGFSSDSQISSLRAEKAALQRRRVGGGGDNNFFTRTLNSLNKAVTGHSASNGNGFASEEQKEDAIASVQEQIDRAQAALAQPPSSLDEIQKRYDDFMAQVPWGQD